MHDPNEKKFNSLMAYMDHYRSQHKIDLETYIKFLYASILGLAREYEDDDGFVMDFVISLMMSQRSARNPLFVKISQMMGEIDDE